MRRSEREREREREREERMGGSIYMVCCVCCHGSSTSFHFRCVYTYAKITHTYVHLHSCVALHLALSMNAAANFCSPIKIFATIFIYLCSGGRHFFTLPEREGEGGREGGREGDGE